MKTHTSAPREAKSQTDSDTQIYPHSLHDRPGWLSSGLINSHQWPRPLGRHLKQNCHTLFECVFGSLGISRKYIQAEMGVVCASSGLMHTFNEIKCFAHHDYCCICIFTAGLTGCQNTVINCLLGSLINFHICQSKSNYSYLTVITWTGMTA